MTNGDLLVQQRDDFPLNFEELEQAVKEKLAAGPYQYIRAGAGAEQTMRNNRAAFENYSFVPRFCNDVSKIDTQVTLFGRTYPTPLLFAPVGANKMAHEDGELAVVRAAQSLNMPYIQSTVASHSIEQLAEAAPNHPKWFQLYWSANEEVAYSMVARAEAAGFEAIVLTVDTVTLGWREQDMRLNFSPLAAGFASANYTSDQVFQSLLPDDSKEAKVALQIEQITHPRLNWNNVRELKERTKLPVLLKGILHEDDAQLALEAGVDGIIVSNHGGRQLDSVIASLDVLPIIVEKVAGRVPVIFDSGVYRGMDVLKALALGADAVAVGRPFIYGLAYAGQQGVQRVMQSLVDELHISMQLAGASNIATLRKLRLMRK